MLYQFLKTAVVAPVINTVFRPEVVGAEHVPETGAAILASNHLSVVDSVFLPVALRRQVYFLAKSDYFTGPGLKGRIVAAFFRGVGQIPMDRSGGARSAQSLDQGAQALREGKILGIYPEGTRSPDGRQYRPKVGVARLALETGAPVIPVAMVNTDKVQPAGTTLPRRRAADGTLNPTVRTIIGEPVDLSAYRDRPMTHALQREVAQKISEAIRELSGQEYVDVYGSSVKGWMEKNRVQDAKDAVAALVARAQDRAAGARDTVQEHAAAAREKVREQQEKARDRKASREDG